MGWTRPLAIALSASGLPGKSIRQRSTPASPRPGSCSRPQLALAWTLRDQRVTSTLIGASSLAQLRSNLAVLHNADLSDDELTEIDRFASEGGVNRWVPAGRKADRSA
ncbi:MAG: hypothetical protein EA387_12785 [Nitriliruptor sp.]|nr:MAG: hypothetical protein EA387_12785 [Nitriliruptor sp.]